MLIDGRTIITGSYNFSGNAESNAENLLVIEGKDVLMRAYAADFSRHALHAKPYVKPMGTTGQPEAAQEGAELQVVEREALVAAYDCCNDPAN